MVQYGTRPPCNAEGNISNHLEQQRIQDIKIRRDLTTQLACQTSLESLYNMPHFIRIQFGQNQHMQVYRENHTQPVRTAYVPFPDILHAKTLSLFLWHKCALCLQKIFPNQLNIASKTPKI